MTDFCRFPHTPHIAWLGEGMPRDDKVLAPHEVEALLSGPVRVEEKLDGANLGISLGPDGALRAQNRGQYLTEPFTGQFSRLGSWLAQHQWALTEKLTGDLILFGEWCAAKHSLDYENLPDWFVLFDVYDRKAQRFWSSARRNALAAALGLSVVSSIYEGGASLSDLKKILTTSTSRYRNGPPEGLVIRQESADWCEARAKLVRAEFTQTISEHWRSRAIQWNRVKST
ncbi:MAG: RNA ligase family protein [Porticoccaceae bacterium]|nr:RNA ligase family protein [Porticoccaceae bacterium]